MTKKIDQCQQCDQPHDKLFLHSRCHTDMPTWAIYDNVHQQVEIICCVCRAPIVTFKVSEIKK